MLTAYLNAAMSHAEYEDIGDEGWFARIPEFAGLWANAPTRQLVEKELRSTLEDWLLIGIRHGDHLPVVNGFDLSVRDVVSCHQSVRLAVET